VRSILTTTNRLIPGRRRIGVARRLNILNCDDLYDIMNLMHVRRFWVAGIVLAAVVALLPFSFHAERHLETATRVEGSEAETVRQELASRFHSPFVDRVVW
jgi:hypothetical protein